MLPGILSLAVAYMVTLLIQSTSIIGSPLTPEGIEYGNAVFQLIIMAVIFVVSFAILDRLISTRKRAGRGSESNPSWTQLLVTQKDKSEQGK